MTPEQAAEIVNKSKDYRCLDLRERYAKWGIAEWWAVYPPVDDYDLMDLLTDDELIAFAKGLEVKESG